MDLHLIFPVISLGVVAVVVCVLKMRIRRSPNRTHPVVQSLRSRINRLESLLAKRSDLTARQRAQLIWQLREPRAALARLQTLLDARAPEGQASALRGTILSRVKQLEQKARDVTPSPPAA